MEAALAGRLLQRVVDGHESVDADAAVALAFRRNLREPMLLKSIQSQTNKETNFNKHIYTQ